jgi:hypothetical protein
MIDIFTAGRMVCDEDCSPGFIFRAESSEENLSQAWFHIMQGSVEDPQRRVQGPSHTFGFAGREAIPRLRFNRSQHS